MHLNQSTGPHIESSSSSSSSSVHQYITSTSTTSDIGRYTIYTLCSMALSPHVHERNIITCPMNTRCKCLTFYVEYERTRYMLYILQTIYCYRNKQRDDVSHRITGAKTLQFVVCVCVFFPSSWTTSSSSSSSTSKWRVPLVCMCLQFTLFHLWRYRRRHHRHHHRWLLLHVVKHGFFFSIRWSFVVRASCIARELNIFKFTFRHCEPLWVCVWVHTYGVAKTNAFIAITIK